LVGNNGGLMRWQCLVLESIIYSIILIEKRED
jgi:hypothetical protein